MVGEYTRHCLAIVVARRESVRDVLRMLAGLMLRHGIPKHIKSNDQPEFVASLIRHRPSGLGVGLFFIEPGSLWANGHIQISNGKFRDELPNGEIFTTPEEAKVMTEVWRRVYNQIRPHSALGL